jgi:hypothetical protein
MDLKKKKTGHSIMNMSPGHSVALGTQSPGHSVAGHCVAGHSVAAPLYQCLSREELAGLRWGGGRQHTPL